MSETTERVERWTIWRNDYGKGRGGLGPWHFGVPIGTDAAVRTERIEVVPASQLDAIREATEEKVKAEFRDGLEERMPDWLLKDIRQEERSKLREALLSDEAVEAAARRYADHDEPLDEDELTGMRFALRAALTQQEVPSVSS